MSLIKENKRIRTAGCKMELTNECCIVIGGRGSGSPSGAITLANPQTPCARTLGESICVEQYGS